MMGIYLLHYRDNHGKRELFINKFIAMFGLRGPTIDISNTLHKPNARSPIYLNLEEALADPRYEGHQWVWLDHRADMLLDELEHPADKVVYCIGDNIAGFDNRDISELPGIKVKLRQPKGEDIEWFSTMVAPLVVYDRFLYLSGRRK